MAAHSSVLAWRRPGTTEPGGLPSMGSYRLGHDKWLSSSSRVGKGNQTCLPFLVYGITSTFLPRGWWSFAWWSQPIFLALTVISFPWFYHGKEINIFSAHFLSLGSPLKYCSLSHVSACIWLVLLSIHRIKNAIAYLHWSIFTLMDDKLYLGLDDLDWGI